MQVASDQSFPKLEQLSFFLPNRIGALQQIADAFQRHQIVICALSIRDAHDHAVIRVIVDRPAKATTVLEEAKLQVLSTPILGVTLSTVDGAGIADVFATLLRAELNVHYAYGLVVHHHGRPILAIHVDDPTLAVTILRRQGLDLVDQRDLETD